MRFPFRRRLNHPFFPALKLTPATEAKNVTAALCGDFAELCRAAARGVRVERAVFPLLSSLDPVLTNVQRDLLWELFEVPIYLLLLDGHGLLAGYECEAQHGIHVVDGYRQPSDVSILESNTCECGRSGARLVPPTFVEEVEESALLAG